ncbi:MAG: ABC-type multidrug transport system fused ATPase/permease subunit [Pedosphaera sp.]|nr:ABC-type multidrug transport system fused ATPase/permease subunit [Pedosphaera sp.]
MNEKRAMSNLKNIFQFGWPYLKRYRGRLIAGILLGLVFGVSNASFVWATRTLFDRLTPPEQREAAPVKKTSDTALARHLKEWQKSGEAALDPLLPLRGRPLDPLQIMGGMLLLPLLVFVRGSVGYLNSYCMSWVSERVIKDLRLDLLIKLNTLSMDFFNRSTVGELLGRINGDTMALYRCMSLGFSDLVKEPITVVSVGIGLLLIDWQLTLLSVMFIPFIIIPIRVLSRKTKKALHSGIKAGVSQDSLVVEVYTSIRIVKAFCLESFQIERFRNIYQRLVHIGMKSVQAKELINPIIEVISVMGLGVVIVFIFYTHKTIPNMVGFLTGIILLYTPIKKLGGIPIYFQQASIGSERLIGIFNLQPSVVEKPDALRLKSFSRELAFENVSFSYGDKPVLQNFTLRLPRGFRLGVAGESGSGKSTLMNLIFRFYDPTGGCIKIDGHDLRDVSVPDLRNQLALVSQDIVLFDQTVAENIAHGKPGATPAEIEAAARASYAHEFIMRLPKGFQTRIGETGKLLSGGQRQRLSIARAFIRNAPILVLDEATGNLDSNAEAEVQAAIDRLAEDRTVICVAHRLSTLAGTDGIIVLSEGRIVEQGHFKELLRMGGVFAGLARKQGIGVHGI